jgi:hypothetical protein
MPTIEELFRSKKLVNGQTAEKQYDIRNTADLQRNPYNVLMTPSFRIAEIGRRNLSLRTRERRLEEEVTGLRILATTTSPFLYGTDIIKFTKKSRGIVDDMKGGVASAGILDTFLNKAEKFGKNILSKLGARLPEKLIPSRIILDKTFNTGKGGGGEYNTMVILNDLKTQSGGNFLGKLINDNLKGRPNENQIIGSALELGKKKLNNLLLGSPSQAAVNFANAGGAIYGSDAPYGKVVSAYLDEDFINLRKDLSTKYNNYEAPSIKIVGNYIGIPNVIKNQKTRFTSEDKQIFKGRGPLRGMYTKSDYLNRQVAYPSETGLKNDLISDTEKQLDSYDFITLKFWSVYKKAAVNFRATINGLTETLSPNWDTNRFVGNPFNFYTYNNIDRKLNFSFKIYSLGESEHIAAWQRINFLSSLVYPQEIGPVSITPPFIKFTLGDMFKNKEAFIESLTYTIDDNTPWEVGLNGKSVSNYKLPTIINVDVSLTLLETIGTTYKQRLYGYGEAVNSSEENKADSIKNLNADGSPKPKKEVPANKTVKEDGKEQKAKNPSEEKPKPTVFKSFAQNFLDEQNKQKPTVFKSFAQRFLDEQNKQKK